METNEKMMESVRIGREHPDSLTIQPSLRASRTTIWMSAWGVFMLIGCATTPAKAASAEGERTLSDAGITDTIDAELLMDSSVTLNDINVSTSEGIVTLSGKTGTLLAKDRAERIAMTVKGVRAVVNQIAIEPHWERTDWEVKQDAEKALLYDPATDAWGIEVRVEDGIAHLTGRTDSYQEAQLAETLVKGVKGVKAVNNEIRVEFKVERDDSEIREEIEAALRWDVLVDSALVNVKVEEGKATLSGTVGSAAEKLQTFSDAWVSGVREVDDSGLKVAYWARDKKLRKKKHVRKPDSEIQTAVEDALVYDPRVVSFNVKTRVKNGVVTLRGTVDNLRARRAAEQDARNTVGAMSVRNHIRVQVDSPSDGEIAKRIRNVFVWDPYVERYELVVNVNNGVAYLSGTVDSYFEKARADNLAAGTDGVTEVRNNISVAKENEYFAYSPYTYEYDPLMYDWYGFERSLTYTSDNRIEQQIESQIWWSPFVASSDVSVEVNDGIATLSGTVDSWWQRREATEEAFEGGAVWVRNKIEIN